MMNRRTRKWHIYLRLCIIIAMAFTGFYLALRCFDMPWVTGTVLFNAGVDIMGLFICITLFYGCIDDKKIVQMESTYWLIALIFQISLGFFNNELSWLVAGRPQYRGLYLFLNQLSLIYDYGLVMLFYNYVRRSIGFKGKLAEWMNRYVFVLIFPFIIMVLANSFVPLNFYVDEQGIFQTTGLYHLVDLYMLIVISVSLTLFIRCDAPLRQKIETGLFVSIPLIHIISTKSAQGNATQYGSMLFAVAYIFAVLFSARNRRLASTQAELDTARKIQTSMIPNIFPPFPEREEFDIYASMDPAREVGGDFYDFYMIDHDHLCITMADVSGKGIPGAMFMMFTKIILQNIAMQGRSPAAILKKANSIICSHNKEEMFVTVWIGILEISTGKITAANAGHEYPVFMKKGQPYEMIKDKHGLVIGAFNDSEYSEYVLQMEEGDKLFLYTDGVPEAVNRMNAQFSTDGLLDALNTATAADVEQTLKIVNTSIDAFVKEADQFDDLTMLCLKYNGIRD